MHSPETSSPPRLNMTTDPSPVNLTVDVTVKAAPLSTSFNSVFTCTELAESTCPALNVSAVPFCPTFRPVTSKLYPTLPIPGHAKGFANEAVACGTSWLMYC